MRAPKIKRKKKFNNQFYMGFFSKIIHMSFDEIFSLPVALEMTPGARLGLILQASVVLFVDTLLVVVVAAAVVADLFADYQT